MVTVAVGRETAPGERRVALVPESVSRLTKADVKVRVERGAGHRSLISDEAYEKAGAALVAPADLLAGADVLVRVRRPTADEANGYPNGLALIALLQPGLSNELDAAMAQRNISGLALEKVPRITRAQAMDVLSSQSTVAGYKAVLIAAAEATKFLPMLTTAAGAIPPAKVLVIGAGVAGLQAIATARRLGALVYGFDIRAAAAEQVRSLGATFVSSEALPEDAETKGGYAREQSEDEQQRTLRTIAEQVLDMDIVITTAQIPGRAAPRLITADMVASMRPGSVIVDLAAETGGNCELTSPGESIEVDGVKVLGPLNLPASLPLHASQMFSRNVLTLLQHMIKDGELKVDSADEIVGPMLVSPAVGAPS